MYVCYVDESGHCGKKYDTAQPVETICGVITDVSKLFKTQRQHSQLIAILQKYNIDVAELKASHAYGGRKEWRNVDAKVRDSLFELMFDWFQNRYCKFSVCPIDSRRFFDEKKQGNQFASKNSAIRMRLER